jgi:hypothetical protein
MPQLLERNQTGKIQSFEELVAVADMGALPFTSMLPKGKKLTDSTHTWQLEKYDDEESDHEGTPDGVDVTDVENVGRDTASMTWQLFRRAFGISTLAGQTRVHGVKNEMARQVLANTIIFKRKIEKRLCSGEEARTTDDGTRGYETRGVYGWLQNTAQSVLPVPDGYRPQAPYSGTLANFSEDSLKTLMQNAFIERNGQVKLKGFVGIKLKEQIGSFLSYRTDKSSKTVVQSLNANRDSKLFMECVDRVVTDSGEIDLFPHAFLRCGTDGNRVAGSHLSGFFIDPKMWMLNWNMAPETKDLEDRGGGPKKYIQALATLICLNPLGQFAATIDS